MKKVVAGVRNANDVDVYAALIVHKNLCNNQEERGVTLPATTLFATHSCCTTERFHVDQVSFQSCLVPNLKWRESLHSQRDYYAVLFRTAENQHSGDLQHFLHVTRLQTNGQSSSQTIAGRIRICANHEL